MKKELEYEEAPSGFIWLQNAKEPLMAFEQGFGYQGVLALDGDLDKIQCHFCGDWFGTLSHHLRREHAMSVHEYKTAVGLFSKTALISEGMRNKLVASGLDKRLQNLRANRSHSPETREKIRQSLQKNVMEKKNQNGT